jgi:hypothetical protein
MRTIATYTKPEEAHLAASLLEANGISTLVRDEHMVSMNWFYSQAVGGVRLEVPEEQWAAAREILELPAEESTLLRCPHCGSSHTHMRELSLLNGLLLLFFSVLLPVPNRRVDCLDCGRAFSWKPGPEPAEPNPPR